MQVIRHINRIFSSNSYLLVDDASQDVWVIDPGDSKFIVDYLTENKKKLVGILITHAHFDHIYGINDLQEAYPQALIYSSLEAKEGLLNSRINRSYYTDEAFEVTLKDSIRIIEEGKILELWKGVCLTVYLTDGHSSDCLSFQIGNRLFTGDALIPGVEVFTKSKTGSKEKAQESIDKIFSLFPGDITLYPGHKDECLLKDIVELSQRAFIPR